MLPGKSKQPLLTTATITICLAAFASDEVEPLLTPRSIRREDGSFERVSRMEIQRTFSSAEGDSYNSSIGTGLPMQSLGKNVLTGETPRLARRMKRLSADGLQHRHSHHRERAILFASGGELRPLSLASDQSVKMTGPASVIIPSSGIIDARDTGHIGFFGGDPVVVGLAAMHQVPTTPPIAAAPPTTAAPQATLAPAAPQATLAPVGGTVATTEAPQGNDGGGSGIVFKLFMFLTVAGLMAAAAAAIFKLYKDQKKGEVGGRLGAVSAVGDANEQTGAQSEYWRSTKKRQSYRKAALGEDGAFSDSVEEVSKSESTDEIRRNSGASKSTASYRERRSGVPKKEDEVVVDTQNADSCKDSGGQVGGTAVSYRYRKSRNRTEEKEDHKSSIVGDEEGNQEVEGSKGKISDSDVGGEKGASSYRSRRGASRAQGSLSPRPIGESGGTEDV